MDILFSKLFIIKVYHNSIQLSTPRDKKTPAKLVLKINGSFFMKIYKNTMTPQLSQSL